MLGGVEQHKEGIRSQNTGITGTNSLGSWSSSQSCLVGVGCLVIHSMTFFLLNSVILYN